MNTYVYLAQENFLGHWDLLLLEVPRIIWDNFDRKLSHCNIWFSGLLKDFTKYSLISWWLEIISIIVTLLWGPWGILQLLSLQCWSDSHHPLCCYFFLLPVSACSISCWQLLIYWDCEKQDDHHKWLLFFKMKNFKLNSSWPMLLYEF